MKVRTLDTVEEARRVDALLVDYITFVVEDLRAHSGVSFDADSLVAKSRETLDRCVPPHGRTFIAEDEAGSVLGMAFLRPSGPDSMEIKRLYVRPQGRGQGVGRALVMSALAATREAGRKTMRLDTTSNLTAAIALYRSLGFEDREPYRESDHFGDETIAPYLVFMERRP